MKCARGCCWTPWEACGRGRTCACHWEEKKPTSRSNGTITHRDPTAVQAVNNVMNSQKSSGSFPEIIARQNRISGDQ